MMTMLDRTALTGNFSATLHEIPCEIELRVDHTGCQCGHFTADHERLEIIGGVPSSLGEFYGSIRAADGETVAVFRVAPQWVHFTDAMGCSFRRQKGVRMVQEGVYFMWLGRGKARKSYARLGVRGVRAGRAENGLS